MEVLRHLSQNLKKYFFIHGVFSNASITAAEKLIEKVKTVLNRYFTCQLTMQVSRGALGNLFLFIMQCKFKIPLPPPPPGSTAT